jgi:preprotein translocase subunit YajC
VGQSAGTFVLLAILALPIIMIVTRQRAMKREITQVQSQLTLGAEVMTHSGQFGIIRALREDSVDMEVAPGVVTKWARAAINRVILPVEEDTADESFEDPNAADKDQN